MKSYCKEFGNKEFIDVTMKEAYLKACKWYATNIIANKDFIDVIVSFEKVQTDGMNKVILHLFIKLPEELIFENYCQICQELSFDKSTNCESCKAKVISRRAEERLKVKLELYTNHFRKVK